MTKIHPNTEWKILLDMWREKHKKDTHGLEDTPSMYFHEEEQKIYIYDNVIAQIYPKGISYNQLKKIVSK